MNSLSNNPSLFQQSADLNDFSNLPQRNNFSQSASKIESIIQLLRTMTPLTLPYKDYMGRVIQLFNKERTMIGAVLEENNDLILIDSSHIRNSLTNKSDGLQECLQSSPPKKWDFVFDIIRNILTIWPHLEASGRYDKWETGDIIEHLKVQFENLKVVHEVKVIDKAKRIKEKIRLLEDFKPYHSSDYLPTQGGHLNRFNYSAAQREARGDYVKAGDKILLNDKGQPLDHRKTIERDMGKTAILIDVAKETLSREMDQAQREELQNLLSFMSRTVDEARQFIRDKRKKDADEKPSEPKPPPSNPDDDRPGGPKPPPSGPGNGGSKGPKPSPSGPAKRQFEETLQKTGLTKSYNSCHPDQPVAKGGGSGEIGGVGCSGALIEGLFDSPESLFESTHSFFIPALDGENVPFTSQEMCQIVHELARGIFVHNTVPFFSLHFNSDANLYPVIHPVYENTLVGQIFGMLDYFMKGYLNGGVFNEEFLQNWAKKPHQNEVTQKLLNEMIFFKSYAQQNLTGDDKVYISVWDFINNAELFAMMKAAKKKAEDLDSSNEDDSESSEDPILQDRGRFSNSFRIISKQNGIFKSGNLFIIDSDFDVEYTIKANPKYTLALEQSYKMHGTYPSTYVQLITAYELLKKKIHDHMVKMPFCKKYFGMLGVINFFSYYFRTLQAHRKIPILPCVKLTTAQCPTLFPPLPILRASMIELKLNMHRIIQELTGSYPTLLKKYLKGETTEIEVLELKKKLGNLFYDEFFYNADKSAKKELQQNKVDFIKRSQEISEVYGLLRSLKSVFNDRDEQIREQSKQIPKANPVSKDEIVKMVIASLLEPDKNNDKVVVFDKVPSRSMILPSEQTEEELMLGRRIVGGCGMVINPQKVKESALSRTMRDLTWAKLQKTEFGEFTHWKSKDPSIRSGVIFSLPFMDIPSTFTEGTDDLDLLFDEMNELSSVDQRQISHLLRVMRQESEDEFIQQIAKIDVTKLYDTEQRSLLHHSALNKKSKITAALLKRGLSLKQSDANGYLPIHYAAMVGDVDQLKVFISQKPKTVQAKSHQGATPLIVATQHGHLAAAEYLLKNGAEGDEKLHDGYTPLHCAVHCGDENMTKMLLKVSNKVNETLNTSTNEGIVPLMIAVRLGLYDLTAYLIKKGANPTRKAKDGLTPLAIAVQKDHVEICRLLAPVSILTPTIIEQAIKKASFEINEILIKDKDYLTYVNLMNETPLMIAIFYANIPVAFMILELIEDAAFINAENRLGVTALQLAIQGRFYSLVEKLLRKGAEITTKKLFISLVKNGYQGENSDLNNRLKGQLKMRKLQEVAFCAAQAGNHQALTKLLLPDEVDLATIQGPGGWKIEHYLAKSDGILLFRMRMENAVDVLMPLNEEKGKTLPYIASEHGSWRVLTYLLIEIKGRRLSLKKHFGDCHLFFAVLKRGDMEGIRLFVENVSSKEFLNEEMNKHGQYPAHIAARFCSKTELEYLWSQE